MVNLTDFLMMAETGNLIGNWLYDLSAIIGNFGWTVVVFTLILKLITSPFDIWQKVVMRKNNKAMKRMKPQLEKLQKQYANNQQILAEKQMQLYKQEKFSTFGACLPMILTMVIFFVVFAGFNATVQYQNKEMITELIQVHEEAEKSEEVATMTDAEKKAFVDNKVLEHYEGKIRKNQNFLWIENIFMPDTWSKPIPDWNTVVGTGMGKLNIKVNIEDFGSRDYNEVMAPIIKKYNNRWNGYLILPILAFLLNFVTSKIMSKEQQPMPAGNDEMQKANKMNMKMMQWMMPIMMLVFALLYSSAFTLYMFVSALVTSVFQLVTNFAFKIYDKKQENKRLTQSIK